MVETFKATKLKLSDYDVQITLGTGSFGRVRLAKDKKSRDSKIKISRPYYL